MPYKSLAQEKYFNANRGKLEAQGVDVSEWNAASKGSLPKRASAKITTPGGMMNRLFRVSRRMK